MTSAATSSPTPRAARARAANGRVRHLAGALVERTSVRTAMAALTIFPTALCTLLLAVAIDGRLSTVHQQQQTVEAIDSARSVQTLSEALEAESSPTLVTFMLRPDSVFDKELGQYLAAGYGPAQLRVSRAATDRALAALPHELAALPQVSALSASISTLRTAVDAGQTKPAATFDAFLTMVDTLSTLQQAQLNDAVHGASSRDTARSLQQMATSARLLYTADVLNRIAGAYRFRIATATDAQHLRAEFLQSWGSYSVLAKDFGQQASGRVLALWKGTEASPAARQVAAAYEDRALASGSAEAITLPALSDELALQQAVTTHEDGLRAVSQSASSIAQNTITNLRHHALAQLWWLIAAIALTILFLIALLIFVTRAIARPLLVLADEARQVSQGVLVDVQPSGPREVQVVGRALRAAVDSLRRLQAQAEAVAKGDLKDPTLAHPLPGRLGEVMHSSVDAVVTTLRERDVLQEQLAHQATHDGLTDLPNRAETYRQVEAALLRTRRTDTTVGLLFLDLDRFKAVNDTYGHQAGDLVLETVAKRLLSLVRAGDSVGRLGGDEFLIVTETARRHQDLRDLANRVIAAVNTPIPLGGETGAVAQVGVSIGIAMDSDGFVSAAEFVVSADTALYRAKTSRLGGAVFADEPVPRCTPPRSAFVPFGSG